MKKCKHKNFTISVQKELSTSFVYVDGKLVDKEERDHGYNHHCVEIVCNDCQWMSDWADYTDAMHKAVEEIGV